MSDAVTNVEIEDVLSSIRRLVSENGRGTAVNSTSEVSTEAVETRIFSQQPKQDSAPVEAVKSSSGAGRLVLTDALRVAELPKSIEAEDQDLAPDPEVPLDEGDDVALFEMPTAENVERGPVDSVEVAQESQPTTVDESPIDESMTPSPIEFRHADVSGESEMTIRPWEDGSQRLSEWHSVRTDAPADYEPDEAGDSDYAGTQVASLEWEDHAEELQATEELEPEQLHADSFEDVEPVQDVADVVESTAERADDLEDQIQEAVLDEDMLRDLVGEIVRQELQGPLGERITRNVRKLVRREINRALAARSLNDL